MIINRDLARRRRRILARIAQRRRDLRGDREQLKGDFLGWARTPHALLQSFLAGYLFDQLWPTVRPDFSPLKLLLPWLLTQTKDS